MIISAGATGIRNIVSSDSLPLVLQEYNAAVRKVFIIGTVIGALSFVASLGLEWKSIKEKGPSLDKVEQVGDDLL